MRNNASINEFPNYNNQSNLNMEEKAKNPFENKIENKYPTFPEDNNINNNNYANNNNFDKNDNLNYNHNNFNFNNNNNYNNDYNFRNGNNNINSNNFNYNNQKTNFENKNNDYNNNYKNNFSMNNYNNNANYNNNNSNYNCNNINNNNNYDVIKNDNNYNNNNNRSFNNYYNNINQVNNLNQKNTFNNNNFNSNFSNSNINFIKTLAVLKSSNDQNWKDNLKSFVSSLYYNDFSFSPKFNKDISNIYPLYIFNKELNKVIRDEITYPLNSFLYMSYRSGFINLSNIGCKDFTSDCGWGCMLRCCQMMLSKGLIEKKIFDFFRQNNALIDFNIMKQMRKEVLCLFYDNYLGIELVREHPDLQYFWSIYENFSRNNPIYNSISEIIPPYSIHILCKLVNCAGEYTSNIKMVNAFCEINSNIFNDMNFVHFDSGCISRKKLLNSFCEECIDFNNNDNDLITYNGVDYQFKKGGIVFISLRLGLYNIDESYYDFIPLIFSKFRNNFGIVGGKKNRGYYFIGTQRDNKIIFVDPHVNQQITNNFEKDYDTYYTENLYLIDIKELTSSFTFSVGIFNSKHFVQFLEDLKWFDNHKKYNEIIYFSKDS